MTATHTVHTADTFATLPVTQLAASLTNPRKAFNPAQLQELADSVRSSGVHQPILVRPLPGSRVADTFQNYPKGRPLPTHEIVSGERRYRACLMAERDTIPAMIRDLTDAQVLEIQIIENLQRADLTVLEEAEGYDTLMQHSQLTSDEVAAKISKSRSYVYARLKLLDLSMECKQAMRDGQIDASRALLIARIPDTTLQTKALAEATRTDGRGDVCSVRAFQSWLQANVMLRMDKATFKITDTRLVKDVGSCKDCPKRTGANPDLFADVLGADICIDPVCYHAKEAAHRNALIHQAEKKGMRFIEGKEAKELINHQYTTTINGYTRLGQVRDDITHDGKTGHTLRELLGKDAPGAVLIENPFTQELVEAVPTDEAEAVLLAKGLLQAIQPKGKAADYTRELERLQTQAQRSTKAAVDKSVLHAIVQAVRASDDNDALFLLNTRLLRAWLATQLTDWVSEEEMAIALGYTFTEGEDETEALTLHITACSSADVYRAATIVMAIDDDNNNFSDYVPLVINTLTDVLGIPVKALAKEATVKVRGDYAAKIKEVQAQIDATKPAAKPPLPHASLAQPNLAGGAAKEGAKPKTTRGPVPKAKLSAEQAISGIADAMQSEERAQTTAPEGQQVKQAFYVEPFEIGQRVRITTDDDKLGLIARKWAGKEGTVTKRDPDGGYWDVTFRGRNGGIAMFAQDQLEALEASPA